MRTIRIRDAPEKFFLKKDEVLDFQLHFVYEATREANVL